MYCRNCGKELDDRAVICPNCGIQVGEFKSNNSNSEINTLSIVGFMLSFFVNIAGLIVSIIAYRKCRDEKINGKGLALAGIIIGAVSIASNLLVIISWIGMFSCALLS